MLKHLRFCARRKHIKQESEEREDNLRDKHQRDENDQDVSWFLSDDNSNSINEEEEIIYDTYETIADEEILVW